jgi:hypothetical protein
MYADLGLTKGGIPGNFQADGSDSGSFKAGDSSKSNSNNSSSNNSNGEEEKKENAHKWKILAYKEEDCNQGVDLIPERESIDKRFEKTDKNKAKVEEEKKVQVSGPVEPKREPNKFR